MATPPLNEAAIVERLTELNGWQRDDNKITKTWQFDSYLAGLAFAVAVGTVCEGRDHHPDLFIGWRKVRVSFTTHDAGNKLSYKDFDAADAIERLGYPRQG